MENSFISCPSVDLASFWGQYKTEADNNNRKALGLLNEVFPGLFEERYIDVFEQVQRGLRFLEETAPEGRLIVHFQTGKPFKVELREILKPVFEEEKE